VIEAVRFLAYCRNYQISTMKESASSDDYWVQVEEASQKWSRLGVWDDENVIEDPGEFLSTVFYNRWADGIRMLLGRGVRTSIEMSDEVRGELLAACHAERQGPPTILDMGCGNGADIELIVEQMKGEYRVVGTEIVTALFDGAQERVGGREHVDLHQVSMANIGACAELQQLSPDVVLLKDSLCYVFNKHKVLDWLSHVMPSGATLILVEPVCTTQPIAGFDRRKPVPNDNGPVLGSGGRGRKISLGEWRNLTEGSFIVGLETIAGYEALLEDRGFVLQRRISLTAHVRQQLDAANSRLLQNNQKLDKAFVARSKKIIGALTEPMKRGQMGWAAWVTTKS
jgi:SAM-dependent methyltransferase